MKVVLGMPFFFFSDVDMSLRKARLEELHSAKAMYYNAGKRKKYHCNEADKRSVN